MPNYKISKIAKEGKDDHAGHIGTTLSLELIVKLALIEKYDK